MTMTVHNATDAKLSGILQEASLKKSRQWFGRRTGQGCPVFVAEDKADGSALGFSQCY